MGIAYPVYGSLVEKGGAPGNTWTIDSTGGDYDLCRVLTPSKAELNGTIIGAFLDLNFFYWSNTHAGVNHLTSKDGINHPLIYMDDLYSSWYSEPISNLDGICYSNAAGTYNGFRFYGNVNMSTIQHDKTYEIDFKNVKAESNSIFLSGVQGILRLIVV